MVWKTDNQGVIYKPLLYFPYAGSKMELWGWPSYLIPAATSAASAYLVSILNAHSTSILNTQTEIDFVKNGENFKLGCWTHAHNKHSRHKLTVLLYIFFFYFLLVVGEGLVLSNTLHVAAWHLDAFMILVVIRLSFGCPSSHVTHTRSCHPPNSTKRTTCIASFHPVYHSLFLFTEQKTPLKKKNRVKKKKK